MGRPGGGPLLPGLVPVGELGAESNPGGARFDRTRSVDLMGGDVLRSIAEVECVCVFVGFERGPIIPGDAVCALDGGGGGTDLLAVSSLPTYTQNMS